MAIYNKNGGVSEIGKAFWKNATGAVQEISKVFYKDNVGVVSEVWSGGIPLADLPVGALVKYPSFSYNNEVVIFRVVAKNHSGYPANSSTLMTAKHIMIRCVDAKEPNNPDADIKSAGFSKYSVSNIRQFLTSEKTGAFYTAQHQYDAPPNSQNLYKGWNAYDTEAGFMSRIPQQLKNMLMTTTILANKDTLYDKIFLPSAKEVNSNYIDTADGQPFEYFYAGQSARQIQSTNGAIANSNADNSSWDSHRWFTRSAYNLYQCFQANGDGNVNRVYASTNSFGIPFCINIPITAMVSPQPDTDGAYILQF